VKKVHDATYFASGRLFWKNAETKYKSTCKDSNETTTLQVGLIVQEAEKKTLLRINSFTAGHLHRLNKK
jgi:hypothetical protein